MLRPSACACLSGSETTGVEGDHYGESRDSSKNRSCFLAALGEQAQKGKLHAQPVTPRAKREPETKSEPDCGLSVATQSALQKIEHVASIPAGAIIFIEGQLARGVYILRQGRVNLLTTNERRPNAHKGSTLFLKNKPALESLAGD